MLRVVRSIGLALLLSVIPAAGADAASLHQIGIFSQPIFVTSDPVDPDRLFVVEREGRVAEVVDEGAARLYADLTDFVACCSGERGLLSMALAPGFPSSGLFYAAYTGKPAAGGEEGDIHVDAFVADGAGGVSRSPIISIPHSQEANHNGGQIQIGPDGYLYISTGDGGGGGDPFETGQDLDSLLGKVLRIDPRPGAVPAGYEIPPGNPFAGSTPGADEIWAYGLRNPWRFSFDSLSGDLLIADVGQGQREELDLAASPGGGAVGGAGANYGWSCREGFIAYTDSTPSANCAGVSGFADPFFDYPHTDPDPPADRAYGCAITGGYVVRDASLGALYGRYLYADHCIGEVRSLALDGATAPADDRSEGIWAPDPVDSFGEDSCHRIYLVAGSRVFRFEGAAPADCGGEDPRADSPVPPEQPGGKAATPVELSPVVRLSAARRGGRLLLTVRVFPCAVQSWHGGVVTLNRGGEPLARKRLDRACRAVFRLRPPRRATFRALLVSGGGTYRSQVRKIAFANPTP